METAVLLAETHQEVSRRFLLHAREQLALGDSLQASEKGWGAAAHAVKSIAERRGWRHNSHNDLFTVARRVATELDNSEILGLFSIASSLHKNFYEGWIDDVYIANHLNKVEELLDILDEVSAADNGNR